MTYKHTQTFKSCKQTLEDIHQRDGSDSEERPFLNISLIFWNLIFQEEIIHVKVLLSSW